MNDPKAIGWNPDLSTNLASEAPALEQADHSRVGEALDAALARTRAAGNVLQLDIETNPLVIFSDQHKGSRDGADDFQVAEMAYNQAITYYHRMAYTLLTLGDVEELWEERPRPVIKAYPETFVLEAKFHAAGRYLRVWGNHDDNWRYPAEVRKLLDPVYTGQPLVVREGILLNVSNGAERLGKLFLVHGHQGTLDSDRFAWLSRLLVRYLWRPFQRLTRIPSNTPATDWRLRHGHNLALYRWSALQEKLILIAGHTHRPVFESIVDQKQLQYEINIARSALESAPEDAKVQRDLSQLEEELAWTRKAQQDQFALEQSKIPIKPSYYNSGCCCYPDGSITGLELVAGEIRLVRWSVVNGKGLRTVLSRSLLADVFAAI
jgi:UDP-2,3-diacylglucosamine pyrophosphatase LpxH